jgi:hypothetical protein
MLTASFVMDILVRNGAREIHIVDLLVLHLLLLLHIRDQTGGLR